MSITSNKNLQSLSVDTYGNICEFLERKELGRVACTNRRFNTASNLDYIWRNQISPEAKRVADRLARAERLFWEIDHSTKKIVRFLVAKHQITIQGDGTLSGYYKFHLDRLTISLHETSPLLVMKYSYIPCDSFLVYGVEQQGHYRTSVLLKDKDRQVRFSHVPYDDRASLADREVIPYIKKHFSELLAFRLEGLDQFRQEQQQRTLDFLKLPE